MSLMKEKPVFLQPEQQIRQFGIDCRQESSGFPGISFDAGWKQGGEYIERLVVKNVSTKIQKLKYKLPATKFFSMEFPDLITLSPGTFTTIDVVFRPVIYEPYDDFIYFIPQPSQPGIGFYVPITAGVEQLSTYIPKGIDFGFCPAKRDSRRVFQIKNTGQLTAPFSWTCPPPFEITPASGEIKKGKVAEMTVKIMPDDATVFVARSVCKVGPPGEEIAHTMKISAIGKYPHIVASEELIDFGRVLVAGPTLKKEFVLRNPSLVPAKFKILDCDLDRPKLFTFSTRDGSTEGCVEAEGEETITVFHTPQSAGTFASDHFKIITPGGNVVTIRCMARADGPIITVFKKETPQSLNNSPRSVNFGDVEVSKETSRVVYLKNDSEVPSYFHFIVEDKGLFGFDNVQGVIPPKLSTHVTITFAPRTPGNYYRRIFCLIKDRPASYLDLLGTAFDQKRRPAPMKQTHVDAQRCRRSKGFANLSPDQLDQMLLKDGPGLFTNGEIVKAMAAEEAKAMTVFTKSGEAMQGEVNLMHEFFIPCNDKSMIISIAEEEIDFGACSRMKASDKKVFHVTNNANAKVCIFFKIPSGDDDDGEADFAIFPESADIGPGKTVEFRVAFRPSQDNFYYCQEIEAYTYFKSNRTFRLVNDKTMVPPWCSTIRVVGHTFTTDEQFLPKVSLSCRNNKVVLPPCFIGESVFSTFMLTNTGDTPAQFNFLPDPSKVFNLKPASGLVPCNGFQLVAVRFSPKKMQKYKKDLECILNNSQDCKVRVNFEGDGFAPRVQIRGGLERNTLYFKPTCLGLVSYRTFSLHNSSRIPCIFRWELPVRLQGVIAIEPLAGKLDGNTSMEFVCSFSPKISKIHTGKIPLSVKTISTDRTATSKMMDSQKLLLSVVGEGTCGAILFDPPFMDFETTLVNTREQKQMTLINQSDCDLKYHLEVIRKDQLALVDTDGDGVIEGKELDDWQEAQAKKKTTLEIIKFAQPAGILGARSTSQTTIFFTPPISGNFEFEIFCEVEAVDADGNPIKPPGLNPQDPALDEEDLKADPLHCKVVGKASFPTLQVVDARLNPTNTVSDLCTHKLWDQFSLKKLNQVLSTPLTKDEVELNKESSPDMNRIPVYDVHFTPGVLGSVTEEVFLKVSNPGMLPVKYALKFPNEKEVELEQWADEGEPTSEELRQNSIIDQHLFDIQPRSGSLEPEGGSLIIRMHYSYSTMDYDGFHDLPILFRVDKGKMFVLRLCGRTLKPAQPHLHLPTLEQWLKPVPIGEEHPPLQEIQVYNPGTSDLEYNVNLDEVEALAENNFQCPVFECLNPKGVVKAGGSMALQWKFAPLEARQYGVDVKVSFLGVGGGEFGGEEVLQILAEGFHPKLRNPFQEPEPEGLPPSQQLLDLRDRNQVAMLSMDVLDFGAVPDGTKNNRILLLRNTFDGDVDFSWDSKNELFSELLSVLPVQGKIKKGEHVLCKLILKAESPPLGKYRYLDHDVICFVNASRRDGVEKQGKVKKKTLVRRGSMSSRQSSQRSLRTSAVMRSTASRESGVGDTDVHHTLQSPKNVPLSSAASMKSFVSGGLDRPSSTSVSATGPPTGQTRRSSLSRRMSRMNVDPELHVEPQKQMLHLRVRGCILREESIRRLHNMPSPELEKFSMLPPRVAGRGGSPPQPPPSIITKRWASPDDVVEFRRGNQTNDRNENGDTCSESDALWFLKNPGNSGADGRTASASGTKDTLTFIFRNLVEDVVSSFSVKEQIDNLPQEGATPFFTQLRSHSPEESVMEEGADLTPDFGNNFEENKRDIVNDAECQTLIHAVLENTVYNMIQEFSFGEINLATPQKKFYFSGAS